MAIYHLSVSNVSRASGSKATATLSYISGRRVHDERRGETYDYGRKERVLRVGTLLPEGAPAEYADPAVLFTRSSCTRPAGRRGRPRRSSWPCRASSPPGSACRRWRSTSART